MQTNLSERLFYLFSNFEHRARTESVRWKKGTTPVFCRAKFANNPADEIKDLWAGDLESLYMF